MERRAILYDQFGDPTKVCKLVRERISTELDDTEVLVRWLASPINPLDINRIQGAYVIKSELPAVAGTEAMGRVIKTGPSVTKVSVGDQVIVSGFHSGSWCDVSVVEEDGLIKVDKRLTPKEGATLIVNPPTAYVMLRMGKLERGDWVIQNSANSGVGRAAIQIAKDMGLHTINIVRNRPNIAELKSELLSMGGDVVLTEEEVATEGKKWRGKPKLALNGVGGRSCLQIASLLARDGLVVTYGGMSKKPHEISTSAIVFNNVRMAGVAIGLWMAQEENKEESERMLKDIQELYIRKVLTPPPMQECTLEQFHEGLSRSMDGKHPKQIFIIDKENAKL